MAIQKTVKRKTVELTATLSIVGYLIDNAFYVGLAEACEVLEITSFLCSPDPTVLEQTAKELSRLQFSGKIHSLKIARDIVQIITLDDFQSLVLFGVAKGCKSATDIRNVLFLRGLALFA